MKLHMATYFGVLIIIECARVPKGELLSGSMIAQKINMTYGYFCKLSNSLIKAGILASVQGRNGGYYLPCTADQISLYDIQAATSETTREALDWKNEKVENYYNQLEQMTIDSLKAQTIDKFL